MLCGNSSYPFMGATMRRAARSNPRVSTERIAGGHCFMQEQPQASARRVLDYLQALPG